MISSAFSYIEEMLFLGLFLKNLLDKGKLDLYNNLACIHTPMALCAYEKLFINITGGENNANI